METNNNYLKIKGMSPQLLVVDLNQSITFYTQYLGFEVAFLYDDFYAGITNEGYSIHLKSGNPDREERTNRRKNQDLDLTFSIMGIEKFYENLQSKPVEITQPLRKMPYGLEFYIADTDGYIIAFIEENA